RYLGSAMEPARPVRGGLDRAAGRAAAGLAMGTAGGRLSGVGPARGDGTAVDAGTRTGVRLAAARLARGPAARIRTRWRDRGVCPGCAVRTAVYRSAIAVRDASATGEGGDDTRRLGGVYCAPARHGCADESPQRDASATISSSTTFRAGDERQCRSSARWRLAECGGYRLHHLGQPAGR